MSELEVVSGVVSTVTYCVQKASQPGSELMRAGHVTYRAWAQAQSLTIVH